MPSFRELLASTKSQIREVDTATADDLRRQPGAVVLDVREPDEYEQGAIPGAVHIPRGTLEGSIEARLPDHDAPVIIHCASGVRSAFAAKTLAELGYTDVVSVAGGFNKWKDEGRDWSTPRSLTPEQRNRYQRHVLLPEVDIEGQLKLLDSKVLLLGAGGLAGESQSHPVQGVEVGKGLGFEAGGGGGRRHRGNLLRWGFAMTNSVPALLPLALLEAVQNIDTPADDGLGALEPELAAKRLGLSPTVAAQVARYRERADAGDDIDRQEALAVFRLVGRRPDAELVYADAGRRAARHALRQRGGGSRALAAVAPGKLGRAVEFRAAAGLARRWLLVELASFEGQARAEAASSLALEAREDGVGCRFLTAGLAELLRLVVGFEGAMVHEHCRGRGDPRCIWRAARAEGYE